MSNPLFASRPAVSSNSVSLSVFRQRTTPFALTLLGLLAMGSAALAQTPSVVLSLTPAAATSTVGGITTFTVDLTGGSNLGGFDLNLLIDPAQFQFVGTPLFNNLASDPFQSPLIGSTGYSLSNTGNDLHVSFGLAPSSTGGVNNVGPTALGTFQIQALVPVTPTGFNITFGQSEVDDASTFSNELTGTTGAALTVTPAPEPSQAAALGLGTFGLLGLGVLARRRKVQAAP